MTKEFYYDNDIMKMIAIIAAVGFSYLFVVFNLFDDNDDDINVEEDEEESTTEHHEIVINDRRGDVGDNPISSKTYPWRYSAKLGKSIDICGHSRAAEKTGFDVVFNNDFDNADWYEKVQYYLWKAWNSFKGNNEHDEHEQNGRTGYFWNGPSFYFDYGIQGLRPANAVLLTHGHGDHSASLPFVDMEFDATSATYVPAEIFEQTYDYINGLYNMNEGNKRKRKIRLVGVKPGEYHIVEIPNKKGGKGKQYKIQVFKCYHSVPTVGYGVYEIRHRLKTEYENMSGVEIGKLKKNNPSIEITEEVDVPMIVYLGDTKIRVLEDENNKDIFKFPYIMIECTFFGNSVEDNPGLAIKKSHIHWNHLVPHIKSHPNNMFITYHFSERYTETQITEFFQVQKHKLDIDNVFPWLG
jgi:ribonuclease Z